MSTLGCKDQKEGSSLSLVLNIRAGGGYIGDYVRNIFSAKFNGS